MRISTIFVLASALVCTTSTHVAIPMSFNILRGSTLQSATKDAHRLDRLYKRQLYKREDEGTAAIAITDQSIYYAVNMTIDGSEFQVVLDTGSSDLWVYRSDNPFCESNSGTSTRKEKLLNPNTELLLRKEKLIRPDLSLLEQRDVIHSPNVAALLGDNQESALKKRATSETLESAVNSQFQTARATTASEDPEADATFSVPPSLATIDCESYGTLDDSSDTFTSNGSLFLLQYGDTTYALGEYGTADISFGDVKVDDFFFAVANRSNSTVSVFGIGLEGNEASTSYFMDEYSPGGPFTYPNLPSALNNQGTIAKRAYSLYMDQESSEGTLLLGGIDHAKYSGDLVTLPLVNYYADYGISEPITFDIELQDLAVSNGSGSQSVLRSPIPALLDSGSSFNYLPSSTVYPLMLALGAEYYSSYGYYLMRCPTTATGITLDFSFNGLNVSVPIEDALIPVGYTGESCAVMIFSSDRYILGDTFLRYVYLYFDLEDLEVQMALYKSTEESDIEIIAAGGPTRSSSRTNSSEDGSVSTSGLLSATSRASGVASATAPASSTSSGSGSTSSTFFLPFPALFAVLLIAVV